MLLNALLIIVISVFIHLFSMLLVKFLYRRYEEKVRSVLKFISIFSNSGFMGFPVLYSIFGSRGVFYGALYVIPYNVFALYYGMRIFSGKKDENAVKKVLTHPIILSVAVGMLLFLLRIQLPRPVFEAAALTGSITSPLSMLIIGALLAEVPLRDIFKGRELYLGSAMRLVVMPLLVYGLLSLLPLPKEVMQICVIITAMPAAVNTAIMAEKYGGDALLASRFISITTIFSILTIPLILILLS
jgi:predicted permease